MFPSGSQTLEGELTAVGSPVRGAVICHPHPQYGGDMDSPVVLAVAGALYEIGLATLRFNFRGVGASTGSYDGGAGEGDDLRAAISYLIAQTGVRGVAVAGYSFGAMIALQVAPTVAEVDSLIAVAPPLSFASLDPLADCPKRKLLIVGDRDQYCSVAQLTRQLETIAEPKSHTIIAGADHFFGGHAQAVADAVRSFEASAVAPARLAGPQ